MKKYIQKLFVGSLMAGTLLVSSCASDYLDTAPTDYLQTIFEYIFS